MSDHVGFRISLREMAFRVGYRWRGMDQWRRDRPRIQVMIRAMLQAEQLERAAATGARPRGKLSGKKRTSAALERYKEISRHVIELRARHPTWPYPVLRSRARDDLTGPGRSLPAGAKTIDRAMDHTGFPADVRKAWGKG